MFTGYVGLRFEHFLFGTCEIVKLNDKCVLFEQVPYVEEYPIVGNCFLKVMEQYLNQQGKAPKRIQYEVILNAFYSKTDNAVEWILGKYYSLDICMQECGFEVEPVYDQIYYAPACKLPTRYLPTQLSAERYLDKIWGGESCYLGDTYWESMTTDIDLETVYNYVDVFSVNKVLFSNADWECGDGIGGGNCGELPHTVIHLYTKALAMPLPKNHIADTNSHHNQNTLNNTVLDCFGNVIGLMPVEDNSSNNVVKASYQVVSDNEYITTHQLDLTHYPILQPPSPEFSTVTNVFFKKCPNRVIYSDRLLVSGCGDWEYRVINNTWYEIRGVKQAVCCDLFK